jgi:hypothetical protein
VEAVLHDSIAQWPREVHRPDDRIAHVRVGSRPPQNSDRDSHVRVGLDHIGDASPLALASRPRDSNRVGAHHTIGAGGYELPATQGGQSQQSGWYYVSGNKSASSSCTAYTGNSWVTFRNSLFCSAQPGWTAPVDVYVTRNQIAGRYNGTVALSYAMTYSPSCAGFFLHRSYGPY